MVKLMTIMKRISLRNFIVSVGAIVILGIFFLNLSITPSKAFGKTQYKSVSLGNEFEDKNIRSDQDVLNKYANDGWEFVQAYNGVEGFCFIFKK